MAASGQGVRRSPEHGMGQVKFGHAPAAFAGRGNPSTGSRCLRAAGEPPNPLIYYSIIYILHNNSFYSLRVCLVVSRVCGVYAPARKIEDFEAFGISQAQSVRLGKLAVL